MELHGHDTADAIFFYEADYYVFSNFSAFRLNWHLIDFDTSEAAYQWSKFGGDGREVCEVRRHIIYSRSAHEAFKVAEANKGLVRPDWGQLRVPTMLNILHEKAKQHEYVRRKLEQTGERILVEDSWRDGFWGWGPDRCGENMLGKLWMDVRSDLRGRGA